MRQPTPDPFAWHRAAVAGDAPRMPNILEHPQAGYYKRQLVRGGPFVPVRIWLVSFTDDAGELVEDEEFYCEVGGRPRDAWEVWAFSRLIPITKGEFDYLNALAEWAREHAPTEPQANPFKPVDWLSIKPPAIEEEASK